MSDDRNDRSYRPGEWFGIFGAHVSVLLPPTEKSRVVGLWELVDDGADFDELLDALIASGLRSLPGFVLVSEDISPTRVVIRGAARATFDAAEGEVVIDGGQAATWVERSLDGVTAARIETGIEDAEGPDFSIRDGLVRVARVDSPAFGGAAEVEEITEADATDSLTDEAAEADAVIGVPVDASGPEPVDAAGVDAVEGPGQETMPFQTLDDDFADAPADQPDDQPAEQPWGDDPLGVEQGQPELSDQPVGEPAVDGAGGDAAGTDTPPAPEFPWMANQGNVYAPPPAPENPFGVPSQPAPEAPAEHSPWDRPAEPVDVQPEAQPEGDAPPLDAPPLDAPPEGSPADVPPVEADDHDGHTVAGGWDPDQFQRQHPGIPGQPPAPSVTAQPVARLVLSSGETVDVDRAILIGRAPEARRFTSTAQPRLVTVVSPNSEVSSTHVEVRPGSGADHGSAVVTDMGSTNGTVLTLPGFGPEELQPGMAVQLIPGSVIDLGDGVTIQVTSL